MTLDSVCKTALHGWSNQLSACPCTCRSHPLSEERLRAKGLFGALIPTGGTVMTHFGELPATRHMHPWEIGLLNGMDPSLYWGDRLRLAIAAVGQLASPIQSCWVASQVMAHRALLFDLDVMHPVHCLWNHFVTMYKGVEVTQPAIAAHPTFRNYFARVHATLADTYAVGMGPTQIAQAESSEKGYIQAPGQLVQESCSHGQPHNGRADPTNCKPDEAQTPFDHSRPCPGIQATPGYQNAWQVSSPGIQATPGNNNAWQSQAIQDAPEAILAKATVPQHQPANASLPNPIAKDGSNDVLTASSHFIPSPGIQATPGTMNAWHPQSPGIQATPGYHNAWDCRKDSADDNPPKPTLKQQLCPGIQATPGNHNAWPSSRPGIQATPGQQNAWEQGSPDQLANGKAPNAEWERMHNELKKEPGIQATPGNHNAWQNKEKKVGEDVVGHAKPVQGQNHDPGMQATPGYTNACPCPSPGIQATPGQQNAWYSENKKGANAAASHRNHTDKNRATSSCQAQPCERPAYPLAEGQLGCEHLEPMGDVPADRAAEPFCEAAKAPSIQATLSQSNAWEASRPGIQATPGHNNAWPTPLQHCPSNAKDGGKHSPQVISEHQVIPTLPETQAKQGNETSQPKEPGEIHHHDAHSTQPADACVINGSSSGPQHLCNGAERPDEWTPHKRTKLHHEDDRPKCGGIAAFATGIPSQKPSHATDSAATTAGSSPDRGSFSQELLEWANEFDQITDQNAEEPRECVNTADEDGHSEAGQSLPAHTIQAKGDTTEVQLSKHPVQVIRIDDTQPNIIQVESDATVGSIALAETRLHVFSQPVRANTSVGTQLKCGEATTPMQQIYLREMPGCGNSHSCISGCMPDLLRSEEPCTRLQLLHHQEGWVALDEITFYLAMLQVAGVAKVGEIMIMPESTLDEEMEPMLQQWMCRLAPFDATPGTIVTTLWVDHHWFPVAIKLHEGSMKVFTTPGGKDWLFLATRGLGNHISIHTIDCGSTFNNDCGFQAVGWLMQAALDYDFGTQGFRHTPVQIEPACTWRSLFDHHLRACNTHLAASIPRHFIFGGAGNGELADNLAKLLTDRGVPPEAAKERAHLVIDKLGRQATLKAMRLSDPWREIKQLANQQIPKFQIVLSSELEAAIKLRASQDKPSGNKAKKVKNKITQKPLKITSDDVSIPDGVFLNSANQSLTQIASGRIGPQASGVVVVSAHEAIPYLKVTQAISQKALGLLVLDYQDPILEGIGTQLRFPAKCEKTGEAIILIARLIQLGTDQVQRAAPSGHVRVEEVSNHVLRTVTYKDELTHLPWKDFIARPIKQIIADIPCLQPTNGHSPIIDVWDRQFLNDRLERMRPAEATVFSVCFRLEQTEIERELQRSGQNGHYLEPRTIDGRAPDAAYRVIWLNKADKQGSTIASQSTTEWNCIVRSGTRFGLRVRAEDAQKVHIQHKPATPYLEGEKLLLFHAGPFPHGSNRAALSKLFQQWGWAARPCQPKSRDPSGLGVIWEVQATCLPPYEVYQLQHSDVLISEIPKKQAKPAPPAYVQGSAKTLAALQGKAKDGEGTDPWEQNDPWGGYQTPVKALKKSIEAPRSDQLDLIAAQVAQRLQNTGKPPHHHMDEGDTPMADEEKWEGLEQRLTTLERNLHEQREKQDRQHAEVNTQIGQIQQQVDSQSVNMQQHLDAKMAEQLAHIERLLTASRDPKKGRFE